MDYYIVGGSNFGYVQKEASGRSGDLLVIWDSNAFDIIECTGCDNFFAIRGKWITSGFESIIVNVYGPHNDRGKEALWDSLEGLIQSVDTSWLLVGDFNEVRVLEDRLNSQFIQSRADRFNEFIIRNGLIEIEINGRKFTRISDDGLKFSRLDRFLVNNSFLNLWEDLSEVDKIVMDAWGHPIRGSRKDCMFRDMLKNVKRALRDWSSKKSGTLDDEIESYKREAMEWELKADSTNLTEQDRDRWLECRRHWVEKENIKSNMLKQKARLKWALEGDEHSKFFHASIRRKNSKK
ncbi:uncharacterized protein [Rutidosis leptorrhynchoides]|uniref:uncharacterized protein n=1 Tax=Rutidosis leptorrhynchoides TaxID=125765 RepID=UPI003A98F724